MSIRRAGADVDTLPIAGSRGAMSSLAHCLADRWNAPEPASAEPEPDSPEAASI